MKLPQSSYGINEWRNQDSEPKLAFRKFPSILNAGFLYLALRKKKSKATYVITMIMEIIKAIVFTSCAP